MTLQDEPLRIFCDKPIVDFNPRRGIGKPTENAYRFNLLQYDPEWRSDWAALLQDRSAGQLQALVFNLVHENAVEDPAFQAGEGVVDLLSQAREQLAGLRGVYLDESASVSTRRGGTPRNLSPILEAYPNLESLGARHGLGGFVERDTRHASLRTLICEIRPSRLIPWEKVELPALEHLELWLNERSSEARIRPDMLASIFAGERFPNLTYLGLRAFNNVGEIIVAMVDAPVLELLETLDFSEGQLGDVGCLPMFGCPLFTRLKRVDLRGNNLTKPMISRLKKAKIKADGANQRKAAKYQAPADDRYEGISE